MSFDKKLLEPKEIQIEDKTFIISKFPAIAGRKIVTQYVTNGLPKIGNYNINEEQMLELMKYVAVISDGKQIQLITKGLIDNHVVSQISSWEMLVKIEIAMMEYNCGFFQDGRISNFFKDIKQKLPQLISKILKDSLGRSLPQDSQVTEN